MIKITLQYISAAQSEAGSYSFSLGGILNDHHVAGLMYIHCLVTVYLSCTSHEREGEEEGAEGEEEGEVGGEEKEGKRGRGSSLVPRPRPKNRKRGLVALPCIFCR